MSIKGRWWCADKPEVVLPGEIRFGCCSGAEVQLFGSFHDLGTNVLQNQSRPTIHGITVKGEPITLFDCIVSRATFHIGGGGGATSVVKSCFGVVGAHIKNSLDLVFSKVEVSFNTLFDWCVTSGVTIIPAIEGGRFDLNYKAVETLILGSFSCGKGSIEFSATLQPNFGDYTILEDCIFVVSCEGGALYANIEDDIETLQLMLSLACQKATYAVKITGKQIVGEDERDLVLIRKMEVKDSDFENVHAFEMLFTLADVRHRIDAFISSLVAKRKMLRPCLDLYFSTIYDQTLPPRVNVLLLSQALEGLHRISFGGRYVSDEDYEAKVLPPLLKALPDGLDSSFRASLKAKMKFLNEFSLRKRLQLLAKAQAGRLAPFLGEPEAFGIRIAELRNRLTHPSDTSGDVSLDYKEHWNACCQLSLLFETCLLEELGFDDQQIEVMLSNRSATARRLHFSRI